MDSTKHAFTVTEGKKVFDYTFLSPRKRQTKYIKTVLVRGDLSVVIPVFERVETIECIKSLVRSLEYANKKAHLIVIDQSINQNISRAIMVSLAKLSEHHTLLSVIYHYDHSLTIGTAKNKGVNLLGRKIGNDKLGDLIMFIDSDIYLQSVAVHKMLEAANDHPQITAFGFPSIWLRDGDKISDLTQIPDFSGAPQNRINKPENIILETSAPISSTKNHCLLGVSAIYGCVFAIRSEAFLIMGGFHSLFGMHGEHVEFCARLVRYRHRFAYIMDVSVFHDDRSTLSYSVMRNLPQREKFLLSTMISMAAKKEVARRKDEETLFVEYIRRVWLENIGVDEDKKEHALDLILQLGTSLADNRDKLPLFFLEAGTLILKSVIDANLRKYLQSALTHLKYNQSLLQNFLGE